jgi:hypothetical protein
MSGQELTPETARLVERLFRPEYRVDVSSILERECGDNLPLSGLPGEARGHERIRFAVLKVSAGDVAKLRDAVEHAKIDWRDVLMWAGFGSSITEHQEWARTILYEPPAHRKHL